MDTLYRISGLYGRHSDRTGVLVDALPQVAAAPDLRVVRTAHREYVVDHKGHALPVVCGDIVETVDSEGFRGDGRCGIQVAKGRGACDFHADEREAWFGLTEAERLHVERQEG